MSLLNTVIMAVGASASVGLTLWALGALYLLDRRTR